MKRSITRVSNVGRLTVLIGLLLLAPLLVLPFFPGDVRFAAAFLVPGGGSILLGLALCLRVRVYPMSMQEAAHHGNLLVLYIWLYGCLAGALPFVLGGRLTFVQALFEAVSGWTTTGLSVMDVTITPPIFLFYRSFMQFCGGLGFVMIMMTFVQGRMGMLLYNAEGHPDKLMPTLRETVRTIVLMYMAFLSVGVAAYVLCGMPLFDAVLHTMGALSTGGFSNQPESIGAYRSVAIEGVTVVLMLVGTTNFAILLLIVRRKWRDAFRCSEVRFLGALLAVFVPVTALVLMTGLYMSLGEGIRQALFNIVSALSTTGYATMSYERWPQAALGIMILMMLIGGGAGSTAGGIKLSRTLIMLKASFAELRARVSPEHEVRTPFIVRAQGKTPVEGAMLRATAGFVTLYLMLFAAGTLLLCMTESAPLASCMFEFASSLGTVGLSIGLTGPSTCAATLLVEIAGMLLGRLEIFLVFTGLGSAVFLAQQRRRAVHKGDL